MDDVDVFFPMPSPSYTARLPEQIEGWRDLVVENMLQAYIWTAREVRFSRLWLRRLFSFTAEDARMGVMSDQISNKNNGISG